MLLRARKSRMAGRTLAAALACACIMMSGCAEGSTKPSETNQADGTGEVVATDSVQGDATMVESSDESSTQMEEKTEFELAMEINDEADRLAALFELIKKDPQNMEAIDAFLDVTLSDYDKKDKAKFPLELSEEFKIAQIEEQHDKILEKNCKYAQYRYLNQLVPTKGLENYETIYYFDENNRVTYTPDLEAYYPSFGLNGTHSKDVTYLYDEDGRWIGSTRNVSGDKVTDKAVYDNQGNISKVYIDGELYLEFKYNADGYAVRKKIHAWDYVTEWVYDDNGYVCKEISYYEDDGEKEEREITSKYREVFDADYQGWFDYYTDYMPNYTVKTEYFTETGEKEKSIYASDAYLYTNSADDYLNGNVIRQWKEGWDMFELCIPYEYGDGFLGVARYFIYLPGEEGKWESELFDYRLYYVPQ